jgi:hypothetical protein
MVKKKVEEEEGGAKRRILECTVGERCYTVGR